MMPAPDSPLPRGNALPCRNCKQPINRWPERQLCTNCYDSMAVWVDSQGSARVRALVAAGQEHPLSMFRSYVENRLFVELPHAFLGGWTLNWNRTLDREFTQPAERDALEAALVDLPDAEIRYLKQRHRHRHGCERGETTCPEYDYKGPVIVADFHGSPIVRKLGV